MPLPVTNSDAELQHDLIEQYEALRYALKHLQSAALPDMPAIGATMDQIDAVQMQLKALEGRVDDPQRY